jgi:hypothetical protein
MTSLRPIICVSMALSLPACHLIDQRDFDSQAGRKPVPAVATAKPEPLVPPLVTIRFTEPDPPYRDALTGAVQKALSRKPDALFTVSTTVPQGASPDEDADLGARAAESGREVAETIVNAGAPAANVEQLISIDPNVKIREVVVRVQ